MALVDVKTRIDLFENLMEDEIDLFHDKIDIIEKPVTSKWQPIECIICFEDIEKQPQHYRFICEHKDNMHEHCIKDLKICPICRKMSLEAAFSLIDDSSNESSLQDSSENSSNTTLEYSRRLRCKAKLIIFFWMLSLFTLCLVMWVFFR
tara:strand:- start:883 stop:1329 length:447 start_codon:yes stop_codon:yes gene_type:complete